MPGVKAPLPEKMALVSLIDADRQRWKSCIGVEGEGTERDAAFCAHAILSSAPLVVEDATRDPRFADNRFVTGDPFVRFYAGAPLTSSDGFQLGTLCIVDTRPRRLTDAQLATLRRRRRPQARGHAPPWRKRAARCRSRSATARESIPLLPSARA
jgi:GAF domain-containing protein